VRNLGSIAEEMLASEAWEIESRFGMLGINYYVFETNYEELKRLLDKIQIPDQMWKSGEVNSIMYELTRLLHNFLASAKMLVDHTRHVMRDWYSGTSLYDEYQSEIEKRFATNRLSAFIEDLRNYALHYQLPVTASRIEVTRGAETGSYVERAAFELSRAKLREWSGWNKGRNYLYQSDEDIVIEYLVDQYFHEVQNLHQWIGASLAEEHAEDLQWLEDRRVKLEEALRRANLLRKEEAEPDWPSKIPRKAPCPCGSGRKYKNCCGKS
jgi:hypothetical protein